MATIYKPKRTKNKDTLANRERMQIYNTARWRELRKAKLRNNPLCECCLKEGITTATEDIHHVVSFMDYRGYERTRVAFDWDNLMSLCKRCHQQMHNQLNNTLCK